jgi:4-aminobutyrate---pyruvate transaminase
MTANPQLSNSLAAADIATGFHPFTNARLHETKGPLIMDRGEGIYVYDVNGKQYMESFGGLWSVAVGFSESRLVEAAHKQMQKLPFYHTFTHMSHEPSIRLAEKLVDISPEQYSRAYFTNSGSEANDTVIKMIWYVNNARGKTKKKKFLARHKGYHGITMASGSLTGLPNIHRDFDLPIIPVIHLTTPHLRVSGHDGETEAELCARLLQEMEDTILKEDPDSIAAFIGEPLMAAAGVLEPPAGYWQGVEATLGSNPILWWYRNSSLHHTCHLLQSSLPKTCITPLPTTRQKLVHLAMVTQQQAIRSRLQLHSKI